MKVNGSTWIISRLSLAAAIVLGLSSCMDEHYSFNNIKNASKDMELTPGIALPIAYGSLSIDNILNKLDSNEIVKTTGDSLLYVFYSDSLFSYNASDVINIPDQNFISFSLNPALPSVIPLTGTGDTISEIIVPVVGTHIPLAFNQELEFSFSNGERIDTLILKSMRMQINISSTFRNKILLDFSTGSIKIGDTNFSQRFEIAGTPVNYEQNLNNVKMILDTSDHHTTIMGLNINLKVIDQGFPISPGENCTISMSFLDNKFNAVYGFLGQYDVFSSSGQVDVSFLNNKVMGGTLSFADPDLALLINSSFGLPVDLKLNIQSVSTTSIPAVTDLIFNNGPDFMINGPTLADNGAMIATDIMINKDNSNFVDVMETSPDHLDYTATAKLNPGGITEHYNYVTDTSKINIGMEVNLPIDIKAKGFTFEDTLDVDFDQRFGDNLNKITYFRFNMDTENGIPIETKLQVYFADTLYNVIDSMFKEDIIFLEPAILDTDGRHTFIQPNSNLVEFTDTAEIHALQPTKHLLVRASLNTPIPTSGSDYFKFYSFYKLGFKLGATVRTRINTSEL
jgi:hypothetical protein